MKTRFSGIGGLVAVAAVVVGFGAGCDGMEPGDEAEGVEQTSSELFTSPKTFTLHNYQTNYCLGVAAGTPTAGTKLVVWDCDQSTNQSWQFGPTDSGGRVQVNNMVAVNRCLGMVRGPYVSYTNGTPADIDTCENIYTKYSEYWTVTAAGTDFWGHQCYQFANGSGPNYIPMVMGVSGGNRARGTAVIMWENFSNPITHPDQYWCVY